MKKQNFVQGAMILVVAGLITRGLGTIYRIFLSRTIGPEAIGLYQMAFPTLIMLITIVTAGLPIAVSKLVAEADAKYDTKMVKKILHIALFLVLTISLIISFLFYLSIPFISKYLLTDERVYLTLLAVVPIIPIISVSSVLRGYFQGKQNMLPSGGSTIIETIFRMTFGMYLSVKFLPYGVEYASAAAMVGMVIGEIAGFITIITIYFFNKEKGGNCSNGNNSTNKSIYQKLSRIAIPVTTSQIVGSLAYFFEPSIVAHSLALAGIATTIATAQYGQLAGMALLIVNFPTVITYSLSISLIPAISEAAAKKNMRLVSKRLHQALKIAFVIGLPAAIYLFIMSDPIAILLFDTPDVGRLIKIMSPFAIFLYIQRPLSATLQGLDRARESMNNTIIGAISKILAIFLLASQPMFGIDGVAMAINLGMILVTVLHFRSIIYIIGYTFDFTLLLKTFLGAAIMGYSAYYSMVHILPFSLGINLSITTFISTIIYIILLVLLKVIDKHDLERIPWLGRITRF